METDPEFVCAHKTCYCGCIKDVYLDTAGNFVFVLCNNRVLITRPPILGHTGPTGVAGMGIASVTGDKDGHIVFVYTDGSTGPGPSGMYGQTGPHGPGITGASLTPDGELVITYTDGATATAGTGLYGRTGPAGEGIVGITSSASGDIVYVFADGSTGAAPTAAYGHTGPTGAAIDGFVYTGTGVYATNTSGDIIPIVGLEASYCTHRRMHAAPDYTLTFTPTPTILDIPDCVFQGSNVTHASGQYTVARGGVYTVQLRFATSVNYKIFTPTPSAALTVYANGAPTSLTQPVYSQYGGYTCETFGVMALQAGDVLDVRFAGTLSPENDVTLGEWVFMLRAW